MASRTNHSVDRALSLLRLLARAPRPIRFADIQAQSGIPKGTLHSLLASLEAAEFARRSAQGYEIGLAAFEVGTAVRVPTSLRAAVAPLLDEQSSLGEACHFGMLDGDDVVYLDRRDYSHDALHYTLPVGAGSQPIRPRSGRRCSRCSPTRRSRRCTQAGCRCSPRAP